MFTDKSIENESIYDDLVVLQNICKGETDLKNTFYTLVQEQIDVNIKQSITKLVQKKLKYHTEIDDFYFHVKKEQLEENIKSLMDKMNSDTNQANIDAQGAF